MNTTYQIIKPRLTRETKSDIPTKIDRRTRQGKALVKRIKEVPRYTESEYGIFAGLQLKMHKPMLKVNYN